DYNVYMVLGGVKYMVDVAKRLVELRTARQITTNKLANMAGISQSYLREIELGNKNPTVEILFYLCDSLGVSLQTFFTETDNSINPFLTSSLETLTDNEQIKLAEFINEIKT
ncbi:MAG: helix-turn-helix transcriptional regulator, partial [Ruminococcus sp.]|nr:helix-turn-helix transcriptional regulator [Candidatus Copronaster equi]